MTMGNVGPSFSVCASPSTYNYKDQGTRSFITRSD